MQRVLWKSKLAMVSVLFLPSSTFSVSPYPYLSVGSLYKIFNLRSDGSRIRKYVISAPKTFKNHGFDDLWYLFQHLRYCDSILRHPFKLNIFDFLNPPWFISAILCLNPGDTPKSLGGLLNKDAHFPKRLTSNKNILFTWRCPLTMCSPVNSTETTDLVCLLKGHTGKRTSLLFFSCQKRHHLRWLMRNISQTQIKRQSTK